MDELAEVDELIDYLSEFVTENKRSKIAETLEWRTRHISVVLENIYHRHNASACLRSCECLGVQDVHAIESMYSYQPGDHVAVGAGKWLSLYRYSEEAGTGGTAECLVGLKARGYRIVATSPAADGYDLKSLPLDQPVAIVFGTEEDGLTDAALEAADDFLRLPMFGLTESYNISVSVAIALSHLTERLRQSDIDWHLQPDEKRVLTLSFLRRILRRHADYEARFYASRNS